MSEILVGNRELLDAFRRGERQALEAVYRAHVGEVVLLLSKGFGFASGESWMRFRGFSEPLELESFVQEVFVRAFSAAARQGYDGLRPYGPYLARLAKNRVIDELRKKRQELERLVGPLDDAQVAGDDPAADERLDEKRLRGLVSELLSGLPELERRYVTARFEDEQSLLAAARQLGISRMRARVLERRVLSALRRQLEAAGYLEGGAKKALLIGVLA